MVLLFVIMHDAGPLRTDKGSAGENDHLEVTSHTYDEGKKPAQQGTNFSP